VPGRARFLDSAQLAQLRSEQDDVLSRAQASEHGIDHRTIRRRVAADQWQTVGPAVVVLHNGPLSIQQQRWAGVLHAGAGAALAGLTALQAAGLDGFETDVIHVVVAHGQGRRHLVDERIHVAVRESTHLEPDQVLGVRKPRPSASTERRSMPPHRRGRRAAAEPCSPPPCSSGWSPAPTCSPLSGGFRRCRAGR
jgi:hypothetical protein